MKSAGRTDGEVDVAAVEIRIEERHEALALMAALIPFHSFMVQHDREHWVVHARVPGCHGEDFEDLVTVLERWRSRIDFDHPTCALGDRDVGNEG
jgi:hypothetical protein